MRGVIVGAVVLFCASGCFGFRQVPHSQLPEAVEVGKRYRIYTKKRAFDLMVSANNEQYVAGVRQTPDEKKGGQARPVRVRWRNIQSVEERYLRLVPTAAASGVGAIAVLSVILALTGGSFPSCATTGMAPPPPGRPPSQPP